MDDAFGDGHGHTVGDEVLKGFADVLKNVTRGTDIIARYGGDEFVAILPRAAVVGEAMVALVLADALLATFGGDTMGDLLAAVQPGMDA